jgi:proteasome accessory factor B
LRRGRFTVVGFCHLRGAIRTFHGDRIEACVLAGDRGLSGDFVVPADFRAEVHVPAFPWQLRVHPPIEVTLSFAPELAATAAAAIGVERHGRVSTTNLDGLLAQVLAFGAGARVVAPDGARQRMRELLSPLLEAKDAR